MTDNLAKRVDGTYRLDINKFRDIVNILYDAIDKLQKISDADTTKKDDAFLRDTIFSKLEIVPKPEIVPNLSLGSILVKGAYIVNGESNWILFGYVGRIIDGRHIGHDGPLFLQTFMPPDNKKGRPIPDLVDLLRGYIK